MLLVTVLVSTSLGSSVLSPVVAIIIISVVDATGTPEASDDRHAMGGASVDCQRPVPPSLPLRLPLLCWAWTFLNTAEQGDILPEVLNALSTVTKRARKGELTRRSALVLASSRPFIDA